MSCLITEKKLTESLEGLTSSIESLNRKMANQRKSGTPFSSLTRLSMTVEKRSARNLANAFNRSCDNLSPDTLKLDSCEMQKIITAGHRLKAANESFIQRFQPSGGNFPRKILAKSRLQPTVDKALANLTTKLEIPPPRPRINVEEENHDFAKQILKYSPVKGSAVLRLPNSARRKLDFQ